MKRHAYNDRKRWGTSLALAAALVFPVASASATGLDAGPYVGGQIGWASFDMESRWEQPGEVFRNEGYSASGLAGGVYGGYHWSVGIGFIGLEGNIGRHLGEFEEAVNGFRHELEPKESYGIAVIGGHTIGSALLYGRLGWQQTRIDMSVRDPNPDPDLDFSFSDDDRFDGLRIGLGTELPLQDRLSLRLDWSLTFYGSETFRIDDNVQQKVTPQESLYQVGLTYQF